jgi:chromosomal replication initiation ATPase DnaA
MDKQYPMDLGYREIFSKQDFCVFPGNQQAMAWVDRWPDWPSAMLVLVGPEGAGKTHLLHAWLEQTRGHGHAACATLDDIDRMIGNLDAEKDILHRYNLTREEGGFILAAASSMPATWSFKLPDLASRILSVPAILMGPPDDGALAAILVKLFSDRQIYVTQDVVGFIVSRCERSVPALKKIVEQLDHAAMAQKRAITVPFAKQVLGFL